MKLTGSVKMGGGGGECQCRLSEDLTVSNPLGRYEMDEVIKKGETFEHIFQGILGKTHYPTLVDPSVSISFGARSPMKVGSPVDNKTATLTFNRGSISPQYGAESKYRSGEATGFNLSLTGADVSYSDSNNSGVFKVPTFTKTTAGIVTINGSASYGAGCQPKDSDGKDYGSALPAGTKTTSMSIEFILPFYFGVSDTVNIDGFDGFTEVLNKDRRQTHYYTTNNQYAVFAYDKSYGELSKILDQSDFESEGWHTSEIVVDGQSYKVYVAEYKTTDTDARYTFIF